MAPDTNFMLMEQSGYFNDMHGIQHTKTYAVHTKSAHKYPIKKPVKTERKKHRKKQKIKKGHKH